MGSYPLNAVRHLFAAEPLEVHAMGVRTPGRGFDFDDTVAVTLRFPGQRLAQFTISCAGEARSLPPVAEPGDEDLVAQVPQNG